MIILTRGVIKDDCGGTSLNNQPSIAPIDVVNDWGLPFDLGCVVNYIFRYKYKGTSVEDLKKAQFYLKDFLERIKHA